jgi:hypothetical protein
VNPYTLRRLSPADRAIVVPLLEREWALRFYQRAGFRLTALRAGAVTESRKLKPGIPERGLDDIPITDELELQMDLSR